MPSCLSYNECGAYEAATVCIKGQQRMSEAQEPPILFKSSEL